jgi:hypothetical protein
MRIAASRRSQNNSRHLAIPPRVIQLLCYILFGLCYFYVLFLSDCATYTHSSASIDDKVSNIKILRSLPHLKAINTLRRFERQITKQKKRKGRDDILSKEHSSTSSKLNSTIPSHAANQASHGDNATTLSIAEIMGPVFGLVLLSLSCRCLLAALIFRQQNQIVEFTVDFLGQMQQSRRDRPRNQRISFWEAFRTIPMRNNSQSQSSRPQRNQNNQLFANMVRRLNQQRTENGARPLSMESVALLFRDRRLDFSGNDYEALWGFQEENGNAPSHSSILREQGASEEDIARNPVRLLEDGDDLIHIANNMESVDLESAVEGSEKKCSICLEHFRREEMVRTLPCFHSYHANCIDPWLRSNSTCPICKHDIMNH